MKKFIRIFLILTLLTCFTGCGLFNKYTLRDFMCGMNEGHIEITEDGGIRASRRAFSDPVEIDPNAPNPDVLMLCDFECINGYYYIYWTYPNESGFHTGFIHIPDDIEIHNKEKTIYSLTYKEIRYMGFLIDTYTLHGHDTTYNCIDALNSILDGDDYIGYMLKYRNYCEEHDIYYEKDNRCTLCPIPN